METIAQPAYALPELSLSTERLDNLSADELRQMLSEGVKALFDSALQLKATSDKSGEVERLRACIPRADESGVARAIGLVDPGDRDVLYVEEVTFTDEGNPFFTTRTVVDLREEREDAPPEASRTHQVITAHDDTILPDYSPDEGDRMRYVVGLLLDMAQASNYQDVGEADLSDIFFDESLH